MKRWFPHPWLTVLLILLWLLINNSFSLAQIVLGLVLAWIIPALTRSFWPEPLPVHRPWVMLRFAGVFLWDVVVANVLVARLILRGPTRVRPAFVMVPLDISHPFALSLLLNVTCLTPGTVSARLSADRRFLLVHALDAASPQDVIAAIKKDFEAPLKEIFEC